MAKTSNAFGWQGTSQVVSARRPNKESKGQPVAHRANKRLGLMAIMDLLVTTQQVPQNVYEKHASP